MLALGKRSRIRLTVQAVAALIQNANFKGFFTGKIYNGPVKNVCVPGLNCYSCPGAVGACPVGSLQSFLNGMKFKFPYYVLGLLIFFGALLGRAVCGFLCPFGLLQDLIYKIPFIKKNRFKADKYLRYIKYAVLLLMVLVLPFVFKLTPVYCKFLCPSGTVSGLLLAAGDNKVVSQFGKLFTWKLSVLILVIVGSLMIFRPFCKYLCPLGAFYGFFNKVSVYGMSCDSKTCVNCGACAKACKMNVDPVKTPDSMECIRCGECMDACPNSSLKAGFNIRKQTKSD